MALKRVLVFSWYPASQTLFYSILSDMTAYINTNGMKMMSTNCYCGAHPGYYTITVSETECIYQIQILHTKHWVLFITSYTYLQVSYLFTKSCLLHLGLHSSLVHVESSQLRVAGNWTVHPLSHRSRLLFKKSLKITSTLNTEGWMAPSVWPFILDSVAFRKTKKTVSS